MAITQGENITLRARFSRDGDPIDATTPVEFRVKRADKDAEVEGPFTASRESEGVFVYTYTAENTGKHYFSVETADGFIGEGEFIVRRRRA